MHKRQDVVVCMLAKRGDDFLICSQFANGVGDVVGFNALKGYNSVRMYCLYDEEKNTSVWYDKEVWRDGERKKVVNLVEKVFVGLKEAKTFMLKTKLHCVFGVKNGMKWCISVMEGSVGVVSGIQTTREILNDNNTLI